MEWTNDPEIMRAFTQWISEGNANLSEFVRKIRPRLGQDDTSGLFITFAKFSHLYTDHRNRNPHEDMTLSIHRVMNTLMQEKSVKDLFARMAQNAANAAVGLK
tara:strand:+ start:680 stop:988 length:309 start_codon:yes stop_codon:yes gene_type:complete